MTPKQEKYIRDAIKNNYISVINSEYGNHYAITTEADEEILLTASFSHVSLNKLYIKHEIMVDGVIIAESTVPMPIGKDTKKPAPIMDPTAKQIDKLLRLCSSRVVYLERFARRNAMVKGLVTNYKTFGN